MGLTSVILGIRYRKRSASRKVKPAVSTLSQEQQSEAPRRKVESVDSDDMDLEELYSTITL